MIRSALFLSVVAVAATTQPAHAAMRITEWMYNGLGSSGGNANTGEFVELTNVGLAPINMNGWSFDDSDGIAGSQSLSAFGAVAPGESVILTDETESEFRTNWGLSASVKIIGGNSNNLGRNDTIFIYDAANAVVDQLRYGDQDFPGSPRTQNVSASPMDDSALHADNVALWVLSSKNDKYLADDSGRDELGSPGRFVMVPEPATLALAAFGLLAVCRRQRVG